MSVFELRSPLSAEERLEKRRLIFRDVTALVSLFAITATLAVLTYFLFNSFTVHRQKLSERWLARGRAAMASGHPEQAVQALNSALEYQADERQTEIELATALAAAGHDTEAIAYFNTLLETEPGNGLINLQLARLAAKQGKQAEAMDSYQRALDGTWPGDGYLRRLSVRLELARYLLDRNQSARARTQLLIASGNAPDEPKVKLEIAGLMEQAQDPSSAFEIYRKLALNRPPGPAAIEGAGRTAAELGRFLLAKQYLARALADPATETRPQAEQEAIRSELADAVHLLALYPSPDLNDRARAERILHNANTARARFTQCDIIEIAETPKPATATPNAPAPGAASRLSAAAGKGAALVTRVLTGASAPDATSDAAAPEDASADPPAAAELTNLRNRWQQLPAKITLHMLEDNPDLEQSLVTLAYDTEKLTARMKAASCGAPTGEDKLLLQMAQASWAVEQQ
jgi:Tfp pilus assembly protein PilF